MLSTKIHRTGAPGTLPAYNANRIRDIAGLDANRVDADGLSALVSAATTAFEHETNLRVTRGTFNAEFEGGPLTYRGGGLFDRLTVPGLSAELTQLTIDATPVDPSKIATWSDDFNGSLHVEPAPGYRWDVIPRSRAVVAFTAGVDTLPPAIQEIIGVRVRYDYYAEEGDGLAFIHRCQTYNYLKSER